MVHESNQVPLTGSCLRKPVFRWNHFGILVVILAALWASGCVALSGAKPNPPPNPARSQLGASPGSINFGDVPVGAGSSQTVTLTNSGGASLTISTANVTGTGFSMTGMTLPMTLAAGQSTTFSAQFAPTVAGSVTGSIVVTSTASNSPNTVSLTGTGVPAISHSVDLAWDASTSTVTGYNVYRATQSGGPYTLLNTSPLGGTAYTDSTVQAGQNYFYVVTAVDASGVESVFSSEVQATIPTP